jgi:hypothetical protein
VRGDSAEIEKTLSEMNPKLLELLPLSLEEAFSLELSARGVGVNLSAVSGEEEKK